MKKALFICDFEDTVKYHNGRDVEGVIKDILARAGYEMDITAEYERVETGEYAKYDLIVLYPDRLLERATKDFMSAIVQYAVCGGKLLSLHTGSVAPKDSAYEYVHLMGGRFEHHPKITDLTFTAAPGALEHPIMKDFEEFTTFCEPYFYELDPFVNSTLLLEYTYEGQKKPAGWTHRYGKGTVVYLQPGHRAVNFENPAYQKLIISAVKWLGNC